MARGPQDMMRAVVANLPEKTGKTLEQWVAILRKSGPAERKEQVAWLKSAHGLGHVTAQVIVANAAGEGDAYENTQKFVDDLFGKGDAPLRKIYDRLVEAVKALPGTEIKPCKTYVPFSHRVQFARVKPAGKTHVEVLLALDKEPAKGRLAAIKSNDGRLNRKVELGALGDVDAEVRGWLKKAHAAAA